MKRFSLTVVFLILVVVWGSFVASAAQGREDAAAVSAARQWLRGVDGGGYAESWRLASFAFRSAITQERWVQSLEVYRKPLGKIVSRKVMSSAYTRSLPGAPDGQYVVIQFETVFEKKQAAVETVTPMLEEDGKWRVSGYFVR